MVIPPEKVRIEESRYAYNNIIISDSTLRNILPTQLKKMFAYYKVVCGCECCLSSKSMHYYLLTCRDHHLKQLKDQSHNVQNRRSGEIVSQNFETYKNSVRPCGVHIYTKASEMATAKISPFPYLYHTIPHCKYLLRCCDKCPSMFIPSQEENIDTTNTCPTIHFMSTEMHHVVYFMADFHTKNAKHFQCVPQGLVLITSEKLYTQKEPVLLEIPIAEFHEKFYTPAI